jgi:hypothetical protein
MAQGSYHDAGAKAPEGQRTLPQMAGTPWLASGLYPGWQTGSAPSLTDPRPTGPDTRELGRGPIDPALGRFQGVRLTSTGLVLEYDVRGARVQERVAAGAGGGSPRVTRAVRLATVPEPLWLVLGRQRPGRGGLGFAGRDARRTD